MLNLLDRAKAYFSSTAGLQIAYERATMAQIMAMTGKGDAGYGSNTGDRTVRLRPGATENAIDRNQIRNKRNSANASYRENTHVGKIVSSLQSKVVGRGYQPIPQSLDGRGEVAADFRTKARQLWLDMTRCIDWRGMNGGLTFQEMQRQILTSVILDGECFLYIRQLDAANKSRLGSPISIAVQLIHGPRVDETCNTDGFVYGIKSVDGVRKTYRVLNEHPDGGSVTTGYMDIAADEIIHCVRARDIDQVRGVTWLASSIDTLSAEKECEKNETIGVRMRSCVVFGVKRGRSKASFGVASDEPTTDADGNRITNVTPGMMYEYGEGGGIDMQNPGSGSSQVTPFLEHLIRSAAVGVPGVKPTTLSGDYKRSSFSSEKAGDNDIWPEIEAAQDWYTSTIMQPLYEAIVTSGVVNGYFKSAEGFSLTDFNSNKRAYLHAIWRGPTCKSIKPTEDEDAATKRMRNLRSSPQRNAQEAGVDWEEIIDENAEFVVKARAAGMPEWWISQALGLESGTTPDAATDGEDGADNEDVGEEEETDSESSKPARQAGNPRAKLSNGFHPRRIHQ